MTTATVTRRGFGGGLLAALGLGAVALSGLGTIAGRVSTMDVGTDTTVDTTGPHAWTKHGPAEVQTVRDACKAVAISMPEWFNRPPCKDDGRFRFWVHLANGKWGVWVLEQLSPGVFKEITAFITNSQDYIRTVRDDCGIDDWLGHSYAYSGRKENDQRAA